MVLSDNKNINNGNADQMSGAVSCLGCLVVFLIGIFAFLIFIWMWELNNINQLM